jgi:hypothetical protein
MTSDINAITLRLEVRREGNVHRFIVAFANSGSEIQALPFGGNVAEAAMKGLRIRAGNVTIAPAEYRIANRKAQPPTIEIAPGEVHHFVMDGVHAARLLRFGSTSFIVDPGTYQVSFRYAGKESNTVDWSVA